MKIDKSTLQQKLLEKGWTLKELAEKSGLAYTTVNKAVLSNKNYSYKSVGRIAQALKKIIMTCINGCKIKAVIGGGMAGLFDLILTNDELDCYHLMQNRDAASNVTIELHHILPNEIDFTE